MAKTVTMTQVVTGLKINFFFSNLAYRRPKPNNKWSSNPDFTSHTINPHHQGFSFSSQHIGLHQKTIKITR